MRGILFEERVEQECQFVVAQGFHYRDARSVGTRERLGLDAGGSGVLDLGLKVLDRGGRSEVGGWSTAPERGEPRGRRPKGMVHGTVRAGPDVVPGS
jgi:hypothetical protein